MTDVLVFRGKTFFTSLLIVILASTDVADVTLREMVTSAPVVTDIVPAFSGESLRTHPPDVADVALRGAEKAPATDATAINCSITGLLRPATSGNEVQSQSLALAELCRADLRADACRGAESGRRRAKVRLRAMLKRGHSLDAATKSEEIGEPVRADHPGACVEAKPCAVVVAQQGATVVSVTYRPEDTLPEDLSASLKPMRMVGGMMINTYR